MNKKLIFDEILKFTPSKKNIISRLQNFSNRRSGESRVQTGVISNFGWRLMVLTLIVFSVFFVFFVRALNLQILQGEKYLALADSNKTRTSVIIAERGVIYSRDNTILARNRPSFALELNRSLCHSTCTSVLDKIQQFVNLDAEDINSALNSDRPSVVLAKDMSKDAALIVEANLYQLPGVSVIVYPIRSYTDSFVFAHLLGYVGLDDSSLEPNIVGKSGVEEFYNDQLSGISGRKVSEVDSTGTKYTITSEQDALPGRDLELYADYDLSVKAYELLEKAVKEKKATAGAIVAQDPSTGGVLALVNYPSFDANKMSSGISAAEYNSLLNDPSKPFYNRAISAAYPPGSTFKMITASAALSEKIVDKNLSIFDAGYIEVNGFRFNNWKLTGHGDVDIVRALQVSNDTYFYTVGGGYGNVKGLGIDNLYTWAKKFGIASLTGIDISGEDTGYMPNGKTRAWYLGDTYITAIGQGDVLATTIQMNTVTSYFANGGKLLKPQIVKSIKGVKNFDPKIITQGLISNENYDIVREGMHKSVTPGGTGYPVFDFPVKHNGMQLGGKTGTSEFIGPDGKPDTHAWFTVFGPFDGSKATISLTVFLEGGGSGSDDAAPIARELLDLWFK